MQLGSNRVWDYTADNYVHRLIQNKTDGKLVQFDESGRVVFFFNFFINPSFALFIYELYLRLIKMKK